MIPLAVAAAGAAEFAEAGLMESAVLESSEILSPFLEEAQTVRELSLESLKEINNDFEKAGMKHELLNIKFELQKNDCPLIKDNPSRLNWIDKFDGKLKNTEGYPETRNKILSENIHSARGGLDEMVRAYRATEAGHDVLSMNKKVETSLGKTDIDVLTKRVSDDKQFWIEVKDQGYISNDSVFKEKIDKMSDALNNGALDVKSGEIIKPDYAVFVNRNGISKSAIEYAKSKGIHIYENMPGNRLKFPLQNI